MWSVQFCFDNIELPQKAHDKQAQANAKHVKASSKRRASGKTFAYYFDLHDHGHYAHTL